MTGAGGVAPTITPLAPLMLRGEGRGGVATAPDCIGGLAMTIGGRGQGSGVRGSDQ